jgi:acetate---CoA ligase (ADP-forming)
LVSGPVADAAALDRAYATLQANARGLPDASGPVAVSVEEYVPHEYEAIVGLKHDPTFGPVVLFGLGGVFTEVLRDLAVRLPPLGPRDAIAMLGELRCTPVLERAHAAGQVDLGAVGDAIQRVAALGHDLAGRIAALDVNPVALLPASAGGVRVLDAKTELREPPRPTDAWAEGPG